MSAYLKAIETRYKGYKFRSRLEARWARFFDEMGINWDYEKEGYDLSGAGWYLPDFWLPQVNAWAEVKAGDFTRVEQAKCEALLQAGGNACIKLIGMPAFREYEILELEHFRWEDDPAGTDGWGVMNQIIVACNPPNIQSAMVALITDWLHEHRFGYWMAFGPQERDWPPEYRQAVYAARAARFEHGAHG